MRTSILNIEKSLNAACIQTQGLEQPPIVAHAGSRRDGSNSGFHQNDKAPSFPTVLYVVVEARRVELLSENHLSWLSPGAADPLGFPSPDAEGQASGYGSRLVMTGGAAHPCSRSPLIDAFIPAAVLRVKTAA